MPRTKSPDALADIPDDLFGDPTDAELGLESVPATIVNYAREPRTMRENHHGKVSQIGAARAYRFKDVLDMAYANGLIELTTLNLQVIDGIAIAQVMATFLNQDGSTSRFTAYGDATPKNVTPMVAPHFIRMAETRAQGRALSRGMNLDAVTAEELFEDAPSEPSGNSYQQRQTATTPAVAPSNVSSFRKEVSASDYPPPNDPDGTGWICDDCGKDVTGKNAFFAMKQLNGIYCWDHQQKRKQA